MITENRWKHILGVARKAKKIALNFRPNDEKYAEDMFLLGLLHDIGYEFMGDNVSHAAIGGEILKRSGYQYWQEVFQHGNKLLGDMSDELFILNSADMMTGANGESFTFIERLEEIARRFGKETIPYRESVIEVEKLKKDIRYSKIKEFL